MMKLPNELSDVKNIRGLEKGDFSGEVMIRALTIEYSRENGRRIKGES